MQIQRAGTSAAAEGVSLTGPGATRNFDWDDNVLFMPTPIVLFHKVTGKEREITTAEYAVIRHQLGQPGTWRDYEHRDDPVTGTFRYFNDSPHAENYFLRDVRAGLARGASARGPSFAAFVDALSTREGAAQTSIITARGHAPQSILVALRYMQQQGIIKYLPHKDHIYPVRYRPLATRLAGDFPEAVSASKLMLMREHLGRLHSAGPASAAGSLDQDGVKTRPLHTWVFSDDDFGTFNLARESLSREVMKGAWDNVKIALIYTGTRRRGGKPRAEIIMSNGLTRRAEAAELREILGVSTQAGSPGRQAGAPRDCQAP